MRRNVPAEMTYYGLRSYGTEPQIWGGDAECDHEWGAAIDGHKRTGGTGASTLGLASGGHAMSYEAHMKTLARQTVDIPPSSSFCQRCNAWRGELGQEPQLPLYLDHLLMVFDAVRRVLRDDGTCFVNLGDTYAGSHSKGKNDVPRSEQGNGDGRFRIGGDAQGHYFTNDTGRPVPDGMKPKDLMLIPHRFAIAMQDRGWWVRNDLVWAKTACMPESVTDRATRSHEYIFHFAKSARYYYDADAVREDFADERMGSPGGKQPAERNRGGRSDGFTSPPQDWKAPEGRNGKNQRTVWTIGPEPLRDEHYAAWPTEIPRRCILAGSKPGDTVLDPFIGSGRTGIVADRLGRDCIGIELSPGNVAMSERLVRGDSPLFANVEVA